MLRIEVNGFRLIGARTGVGRYIEALLREWGGLLGADQVRLWVPDSLPADESKALPFEVRVVGRGWPAMAWESQFLPRNLQEGSILFCPSYTLPVGYRGRCVVSNLGIYEAMPGQFPWWHRYRYGWHFRHSARWATRVIANSDSTRDDIVRYYGVPRERIQVVLPGVDPAFRPRDVRDEIRPLRSELGLGDAPYLLFVGKLSLRRHIPELLRAFDLLKADERGLPHHLVIVGPNHLGLEINSEIAGLAHRAEVHYVPHLGWDRLSTLYAGADLFVLPTEHEGLSFTILEALSSGLPVVTLDHAALQNGMREAVVLARSPAPADLAAAILPCLVDPDLRRRLRERSLEVGSRFSWKENARQTLEILREVA